MISPDLNGVRISPTREGVGVNGGALAERLRPGVTGTGGTLKAAGSVAGASSGEAFFTRFVLVCRESFSPLALFLVVDEGEGDALFFLVTKAVDCLAERLRDIYLSRQKANR